MITCFTMDGVEYNVHVISLKRLFEIKESISAKTTQSGGIYRAILGTYYNYQITVQEKDGDRESLDAFWDAISRPDTYHECVFPYNQSTIRQNMYVKSGNQEIRKLSKDGTSWRDITVQFFAQEPKVKP